MATLLEANEVTKIYAKGQRPSLNKVSFNVAESEFNKYYDGDMSTYTKLEYGGIQQVGGYFGLDLG